jgi:hypothetical protein
LVATPSRLFLSVDRLKTQNRGQFVVTPTVDDNVAEIEVEGLGGLADVEVHRISDTPPKFEVTISPLLVSTSGDFDWTADVVARNNFGVKVGSIKYGIAGHVIEDVVALPGTLIYRFDGGERSVAKNLSVHSRSGTKIESIEILLPHPTEFKMSFALRGSPTEHLLCSKRASIEVSVMRGMLQLVVRLDGADEPVNLRIPVISVGTPRVATQVK